MRTRFSPTVTPDTRYFWDAVKDRQLVIQRCNECGTVRHPPGPMCHRCTSVEWEPVPISGRGTVFSFVIPHHPVLDSFGFPYIAAIIELDEGVRFVSNLVEVTPEEATIGMPVQVVFEQFDKDLVLPLFRPVGVR